MALDDAGESAPDKHSIRRWRFVAGTFLHLVLPIYILAVGADALIVASNGASTEAIMRHALGFSWRFLAVYAGVAVLATLVAAALDPILRRARRGPSAIDRQPAQLSAARLTAALRRGRGRFGAQADALLASIGAARWDHADPRFQVVARDLASLVSASAEALAAAPPAKKAEIASMTTGALARIASGLDQLTQEHSARAEDAARTVVNFVAARYGRDELGPKSDSSGGGQ